MRLHQLEVTAFGPFAGPVEVDFDDLSAGGLFLLTGATGAGKSSVLDAVCFALFGQVPGDRGGARHLRSDHARPGVAPLVVLRLSIGDRTFRFARSPAWSRPKQRGSGETRVQAHVVVEELRDSAWVALTNRLDDAGLLVTDLLGMTAGQFTQVAMLPQGRFQAFLRASSAERHDVLQKLFRTDRFEQVERWLVDRRGHVRRASDQAAHHVREVLHRMREVAGSETPESWADDLAAAAECGDIAAWSATVLATAGAEATTAIAGRTVAEASLADSDQALAEGRRLVDLQARAESAARELVGLTARSAELEALREQLAAHRRAVPLAPLVARARECGQRAERAAARWAACAQRLDGELAEPPSAAALAQLQQEAVAARALAEAFRPRADELARARHRQASYDERVRGLAESVGALDAAIAEQPAVLAAARAGLDEASEAATLLPALEQEVARLEELVLACARLEAVAGELAAATADLTRATEAALAAKDAYLDVREARINGMAAELAGNLAVGCACPVCGSASHPAPAHLGGAVVGRADEEAARRRHEDAGFVQQSHEVLVATLTAEQDLLEARLAGVDRAGLPLSLADAKGSVGTARALARELPARTERLDSLEAAAGMARDARDRAALEQAAARQEATAVAEDIASLDAELAALLDGAAPDLDALIALRTARCELLASAVESWSEREQTQQASSEAFAAVEAAAHRAGFADPAAAMTALLDDARAESVEARLTEAEATRMAAEQVLADAQTRAAASQPAPDLDVLVVKQRLAAETARGAASAADAALARSERLVSLDQRLRARLADWAPVREQHAVVAELSQLVEGKGPDNPMRIRLAAFVLAERLRQVVAAANERLARMTGERYVLEHSDDRGAGELRGGLSLRVRDDWSGQSRDPATLSGGETFVVSLALALGLADTVAHEAGGTDIDTLFIDEGFGSLDADTLEDVMDTLDTLRDGGRVVGLVSHVPELRSRITTQLEVLKGRSGSSVRLTLAGG